VVEACIIPHNFKMTPDMANFIITAHCWPGLICFRRKSWRVVLGTCEVNIHMLILAKKNYYHGKLKIRESLMAKKLILSRKSKKGLLEQIC